MGKRTHYAPGVFNWVELATTDPEAAKAFYGRLFGWQSDDQPVPDEYGGGVYTLLRLDGDIVASLQLQPEAQRDDGVPPHWMSCVAVEDADATATRAQELGGTVFTTYDMMDMARMAIVADPTGAFLGAWQAGNVAGAARVNDPGCLTSNELSTNDMDRAAAFYADLFGWRVEEIDTQGGPRYWSIRHEGAADGQNGGARLLAPEQEGVPPYWMPYFTVPSADAAVATATDGGGSVLSGPLTIGTGSRIAALRDPQGAVFAVFEGWVAD
jgi:predicted enzyme related to lactoylglutathione lyase